MSTETRRDEVVAANAVIHPQPRPHRPQWRAAARALRRLLAHPERTEFAFQVIDALDGDSADRGLRRMLAQPQGRELFLARPDLGARLSDRAALSRLPAGSFGRAYLEHIDRYQLEPTKLVELGRRRPRSDEGLRWFAARAQLAHDLWHVLAGCGADGPGESQLLAFSLAQNGGRANWFLTFGAALRLWSRDRPTWPWTVWRSYRRGRNALCLMALPYEDLLPLPLDAVRRAAGVVPSRS